MIKIGVLVCSNGLGHLRRIVQIIYILEKMINNLKIYIYFDFEKKKYLKGWNLFEKISSNKNIFLKDYKAYPFWPKDFKDLNLKKLLNWHREIEFLKNYDYVISDNFVEPLIYNENTIISGSFLWHQVYYDGFKANKGIEDYFDFCSNILEKYSPKIIVNRYFFYPALKPYPALVKVGMLKSIKRYVKKKKNEKLGILFSFSAGGKVGSGIEKFLKETKNFHIYFDKRMKETFGKSNYKVFSYEKDSFSKIHAIIGFAGMGAITESVGTKTPLFVLPSKNPEIIHNSIVLEKLNIGKRIDSIEEGLEKVSNFYRGKEYKTYFKSLKKLDKNGIQDTIKFIKKFIRGN